MHAIIHAAIDRSRTSILLLLFLLICGALAFQSIPKESDPDVAIPIIYVSMGYEGISPEDAERLLARPMENELKSIEGVKEMSATASEGHASVLLEFDAGFDSKKALNDVREKVDVAKSKLPDGTDEPTVNEVNVALFPVLSLSLAGPVPEEQLVKLARDLRDEIEGIPGVLEVEIGGDREEVMEIIVDPLILESYNIDYAELYQIVTSNNKLVAAGALDTGAGRMVLKVPGVIENLDDMLRLPIKVDGTTVVTFQDVASVRRTFKDPQGFARVNGQPALTLDVKKRVGANIIETIEQVQNLVAEQQKRWPEVIQVSYILDQSKDIRNILTDLFNNIISAIILVMVIILAVMGLRSSLLVGLAIPGSFLTGILLIYSLGYTLNIVVLFSLILVVGMLVDGAIVVTELADRYLKDGQPPRQAYANAASRMAWPVIASTATTLVVFLPLLFWPGVVGQFMKYLPMTVLLCLTASLFMALIFMPVMGAVITSRRAALTLADQDSQRSALTRAYVSVLRRLLRWPELTLLVSTVLLIGTYMAYGALGKGVEFFPDVEPDSAQVLIHARGDLSIYERDALVRQVEQQLLGMTEIEAMAARSFNSPGQGMAADVVGAIKFQFIDWYLRRPANTILEDMRQRAENIPGVQLEFRKAENGPGGDKPIVMQIAGLYSQSLEQSAALLRAKMDEIGGFADSEDNRALPGIEWRLDVDREQAARYGADITTIGNAIQMVTSGIKVTEYRPADADDEVDIRIRFPLGERSLDQLDQLHIRTPQGMVAISNFVSLTPAPKTGTIERVDAKRVITIKSDVQEGVLANDQVKKLQQALAEMTLPADVKVTFKGEDEDQRETMTFLMGAFLAAIFMMALILVTQFNSLYQALLVLSAIVFSTAGILLGLLITGQTFGIVMCGIGIIALAGIVVNNNIVLIDAYNEMRAQGMDAVSAAIETGALRLRPVLLTAITTVLGLIPMVMALNLDLLNRQISIGAPSTQWWTQLSSSIAGGLTFATALTLFLTPCLLVLGEKLMTKLGRQPQRRVMKLEAAEG
ncbi:efflux RND transporter permease subunit [Balneatrix alpica]|uniref:Efflux RND transporter permease subunit n=1 Tax=Balneatrix alpica TaxID=75684 RepID=A0ABV5ZGB8_9GAMM|nr:efflux RND transporter permease subunit [Balneatrix alpica]